jgi:hypothetical protein
MGWEKAAIDLAGGLISTSLGIESKLIASKEFGLLAELAFVGRWRTARRRRRNSR